MASAFAYNLAAWSPARVAYRSVRSSSPASSKCRARSAANSSARPAYRRSSVSPTSAWSSRRSRFRIVWYVASWVRLWWKANSRSGVRAEDRLGKRAPDPRGELQRAPRGLVEGVEPSRDHALERGGDRAEVRLRGRRKLVDEQGVTLRAPGE